MISILPQSPEKRNAGQAQDTGANEKYDAREALFNNGAIGPIEQVQVSTERIVAVRGILYDLDPDHYKAGGILPAVPKDPHELYAAVVRPWLDRHPVLAKVEVRNSGRGLHAVLRFDKPVQLHTAGKRDRWAGIIEVVQAALPIDPCQPGITATTRAVGSVNSKNGAVVELLTKGSPVTKDEVLRLHDQMVDRPFRTVMEILTGSDSLEPCPICGQEGTRLSAGDYSGRCYECGNVNLARLYDQVLLPKTEAKGGSGDAEGK